jgi:hypothetical protein
MTNSSAALLQKLLPMQRVDVYHAMQALKALKMVVQACVAGSNMLVSCSCCCNIAAAKPAHRRNVCMHNSSSNS